MMVRSPRQLHAGHATAPLKPRCLLHGVVHQPLAPKTIIEYHAALHREDHFDHEKHMEAVSHLEKAWRDDNKDAEHDALCQYPDLVFHDHSENLWNGKMALPGAIEDAVALVVVAGGERWQWRKW